MSAARQKGTAAESQVVAYLRACGWVHAERRALRGVNDVGDIAGIPGVLIEVKAHRTFALAEWLDQVLGAVVRIRELGWADGIVGVVWHKRRGKGSPADWYVTMTGSQFVSLLASAGWLPTENLAAPYPTDTGRSAVLAQKADGAAVAHGGGVLGVG